MAFKRGQPIQAGLAQANFSPIMQGGLATQQGLAGLGAGIARGIEDWRQKKQEKEQVSAAIKNLESIGFTPDEAKVAVQSVGAKNAAMFGMEARRQQQLQREAMKSAQALQKALSVNRTPEGTFDLSSTISDYYELGGTGDPVPSLAAMEKMQAVTPTDPEWVKRERDARVRRAEAEADMAETKADALPEQLERDIEEWGRGQELTDARIANLKAQTERMIAKDTENLDPFSQDWNSMTAEMKRAVVLEKELGMSREDAIIAAFKMGGATEGDRMEAISNMTFGGFQMDELQQVLSVDSTKVNSSGDMVEISFRPKSGRPKTIRLTKAEWQGFQEAKEQYLDIAKSIIKGDAQTPSTPSVGGVLEDMP